MKTPLFFVLLIISIASGSTLVHSQDKEKALKYHSYLEKRPGGGYLFDRFYNAWLDSHSLEELETFLIEQTQRDDSTTADALILGFYHARQGDDTLALNVFTNALKNDPDNASAWMEKAKLSIRALDFETALKDLDQVLTKSTASELSKEASKMKGRLLLRTGENKAAIKLWTDLLKEHSDDEDLHEDLIENQIDEGLFEEAVKTSKILVAKTKDPYLKVLRKLRTGDIYQRLNQRENALKAYQDCLSSTGAGTWIEKEILSQIEQVYRKQDDINGLCEFLTRLSESETQRQALIQKNAELLMEQRETDKAIKLFDKLLARTPGERSLRESYIDLLAKADRFERAVAQTETLIEQNPEDAELLIRLAILQDKAGQKNRIDSTLLKYLKQTRGVESATLRVARLQEAFGTIEAAERTYRQFLNNNSNSLNVRETFAAFLHRVDKKNEAIEIWKDLATTGNRDQVVRMSRLLISHQEFETAFNILQSRYEEYQNDLVFLGQLCTVAIRLEKFEEAIDWAHHRVRLVTSPVDMGQAINDASRIIIESKKATQFIAKLSAQKKLSDQDVCLLAELLEKEGIFEQATQCLQGRESELVLSQKIRLLKLREDWQGAAEATRSLIAISGGRKSNFLRDLVGLYRRSGQLDLARKIIPEWKSVSPGSIDPWVIEADLADAEGEDDKTIAILSSASRKFPDDNTLQNRLATTYLFTGKLADAKRIYLNLYESSNELSEKIRWISELASIASQEGKTDQLIEQFKERKRNNRQSIGPLLALSEIYRINDQYEDRRKALLEASRLQPRDVNFMIEIARIEEDEGNWQDAIKTLERARSIQDSPKILERIASIHLSVGDEEKGYAMINELAETLNSDATRVLNFADAMAGNFEWERLLEFLNPRIEKHKHDYRIWYLIGIAYEELGETKKAVDSFTKILESDIEIANLQNQPKQIDPYRRQLLKYAPKGFEKYYKFLTFGRSAYTYKNQNYLGNNYGKRLSSRSNITRPASLETAKVYALKHIKSLMSYMSDLETDSIKKRIVPLTDSKDRMMLEMDTQPNGYSFLITEETLNKHPDDLALHYLWFTSQAYNSANPDQLEKTYNLFKNKHPRLSLMMSVAACSVDQDLGGKLLAESIGLIESFDEPDIADLQILASLLQLHTSNEIELLDEQTKMIREKLLELYAKDKNTKNQFAPWIFSTISTSLASGDAKKYIAFLEDKIKETTKSNTTQFNQFSGFRGTREQFVSPIAFPPENLYEFPIEVLNLMQPKKHTYVGKTQPVTAEKLQEWYKEATDPVLKTLLANRNQLDSEELAKVIKELQQSKTANPITVAQLAAGFYTREGEPSKAVKALAKIRYQPMSRKLRQEIDKALLYGATQLDSNESNKKLLEAGKAAALRLSYSRLTPRQRGELISAMSTLEMDAAVEKQEKKLNNTAVAVGTGSSPNNFLGNSTTNPNRIYQLIESGKKDQVVKEYAIRIKYIAMQLLSGNNQNQSYFIRDLNEDLQKYDIFDDTVKFIEDGKNINNKQKQLEYAGCCMVFGDNEKAIEVLKQIVENDKRNRQAKNTLAMLVIITKPKEAQAIIDTLDAADAAQVAISVVHNLKNTGPTSAEEYYKPIRSCIKLINKVDKRSSSQNLQWQTHLVYLVTKKWNNLGFNVTSQALYSPLRSKAEPVVDEKDTNTKQKQKQLELEIWNERWKIHDEMVAEFWKVDQLNGLAFKCEQFGAHAREIEFHEVTKAKHTIINMADTQNFANVQNQFNQYDLASPYEAIVIDAFKHNNQDQLEEFYEQIKGKRNSKPITKYLSNLAAVYFAEPAELAEKFRKQLANNPPPISYYNPNQITLLNRVIKHRKMGPEVLATFFLDEMKRNRPQYPDTGNLSAVVEMGKQSTQVMEKFLNEYCEGICGKAEKRNTHQILMARQFSSYLSQIEKEPDLFHVVLKIYEKQKLNPEYCYTFTNSDTYKPDEFFKYFTSSNLLAKNAKDFRVMGLFARYQKSGFEEILYGVTRYGTGNKQEIIKKLKTMDGFGPALLTHLAEAKYKDAYDLVNENLTIFTNLPKEQQYEISAVMKRQILDKMKDKPTSELSSWIKTNSNVGSEDTLNKFLSAKRIQDLPNTRSLYDLRNTVLQLMEQFEMDDPSKSLQVFEKALQLAETESRIDPHSGYNWQTEETYLQYYADRANPSLDRIEVICRILTAYAARFSHSGSEENYEICDILSNQITESKSKEAKLEALETTYARLHKIAGDNKTIQLILALEFRLYFGRLSNLDKSIVIEWVNKNKIGKPFSGLVESLEMAMRLFVHDKSDRDTKYKGITEVDSFMSYYENILMDETYPRSLRLALAYHLIQYAKNKISEQAVQFAAKELVTSMKHEREVPYQRTIETILLRFSQLPVDEEWQAIAKEIPLAYRKQTLFTNNSNHPLYFKTSPKTVSLIHSIICRSKDETLLNAFTSRYRSYLNNNGTIIDLLRNDYQEKALALVNKSKNGIPYANHSNIYSAQLEKALPSFLAKIEDPTLRYLTELGIVSAKDGEHKGVKRTERLTNMAKRVNQVELSERQQKSSLAIMWPLPETRDYLAPIVKKEFDKVNFERFRKLSNYTTISDVLKLPKDYAIYELNRGNAEPAKKLWSELEKPSIANNNYHYYTLRLLLKDLNLHNHLSSGEKDILAAHLDLYQKIASNYAIKLNNYSEDFGINYVTLSIILGETKEKITSLTDDQQEIIIEKIRQENSISRYIIDSILTSKSHFKNDEKLAMIDRLHDHPWATELFHDQEEIFYRIDYANILKLSKMEPKIDEWIKTLPRKGYAAIDAARLFAKHKKFDQAMNYLSESIEHDNNKARRAHAYLLKADYHLKRNKNGSEAKDNFAKVVKADLKTNLHRKYSEIEKTIKRGQKNKAQANGKK